MRDRTADLLDANQALSQLSYSPIDPVFHNPFRFACASPQTDYQLTVLEYSLFLSIIFKSKEEFVY